MVLSPLRWLRPPDAAEARLAARFAAYSSSMRQDISGGSHPVHLSALGVPVVVRASGSRSSELAQALEVAWEWCLTDPPAGHSDPDDVVIEAFHDKDDEAVRTARAAGVVAGTCLEELMHWLTPLVTTRAITVRA